MWRNFRLPNVTDLEKTEVSPHVDEFKISPHERGGKIRNLPMCVCGGCLQICKIYVFLVLSQFTLFCCKIWFVAIHAHLCGEKLKQIS